MAKIRVYELAQRMGLENKELMERLQQMGVETKSHMSVVDEDAVKALQPQEASSEDKSQVAFEEERIGSGLIRRRRKAVEMSEEPVPVEVVTAPPAPRPPLADEAAAEVSSPPTVAQVPAAAAEEVAPVPAAAPAPPAAVQKPAPATAPAEAPARKADERRPATSEAAPRRTPTRSMATIVTPADKNTPAPSKSGARILGRVELPQAALRGEGGRPARPASGPARPASGQARPAGGAAPAAGRSAGPGSRPARPAAAPRPGPAQPAAMEAPLEDRGRDQRGRNKKKKGKGSEYGSAAPQDAARRRRDRMEVFEPDHGGKLRRGKKSQKLSRQTEITVPKAIKRKIRISDVITVGELAKRMGVKANDLIRELMRQGTMVTINHPLDFETAAILAADFSYEVENVAFDEVSVLGDDQIGGETEQASANQVERPPVVTIMGHVDHGKTSLLDAIRSANIAEGEAGGITQHIGAYDVRIKDRTISFLDTPGHEAFTAMRSRGAQVTDIVILVVAADDGVMPQTKEAISHAKAAGVPMIVAINKIDKPGANPDRIKQELTEFQMVPEEWGGDTIFVEVSAKKRINLEQLLEMILLQAEVLELRADPGRRCRGTIVEARLDKGRGAVATVLVQDGTLHIGDAIVAGLHYGRVRTMINDRGEQVKEAGPSIPVEVTGLQGVPEAGDNLHALENEKLAKEVAQHRQQKAREAELAKSSRLSLDQLYARIKEGNVEELKVIVKADVQGSVEAVKDALVKLSTDRCRLTIVHTAVGGITESDVSLASASDAIITGFNVRPESKAATLAEKEGVDIRLYSIIYDAVADIKDAMEGLLAPTLREKHLGRVEVRETFNVSKVGTVAGCMVLDGKVTRHARVRLVRDNIVVWEGTLNSLKRFKDDVREVNTGYECGIGLERYNDIKVGDIIEAFEIEETKTQLGDKTS
ncbi:translation initiation factor IF-2 [Desulfuromonas thiophila]|uniref:Translation initiation factor IF-2 n=1 Tax=Desulfuromonas thiophila TaxID=57664 RepID=A0A1G7C2N8_9BACT|nr:translation initiation factor IF-2 [Desulfuromonas thiophila]SDE33549.1 bacterial translation initiation factor 2 (bIF-2) [Desulfuromonas thiophila]